MKNYLTIVHQDLSEEFVEEPESPYGFTYADYLTWNFKERIELIRGKIFKMSPAPSFNHQKIQANIFVPFHNFLKGKPCITVTAPIDVRLKGKPFRKKKLRDDEITTVVQPDIIVVCDEDKLKDNRSIDGAPELIVEVLSPGNTRVETKYKFDLYEENGVLEYWLVYPEYKQIHVFLLDENEKYGRPLIYEANENISSSVLKGLSIPMNEIFKL
ncbi:Uma2 family endonuclease [Ferruginibacter sp. SUN106]|uniref:Uma2 family endonuclease n=1 Tax=Ferruginibacter sp. SUN106 TaxID=2978348 RepID=UPI003D36ECDC